MKTFPNQGYGWIQMKIFPNLGCAWKSQYGGTENWSKATHSVLVIFTTSTTIQRYLYLSFWINIKDDYFKIEMGHKINIVIKIFI